MPEAFVNMLAFLGWNPGSDREIFSLSELISEFSLERVGKSGSKYDFSKTKWFNQQHLRLKPDHNLFEDLISLNKELLDRHTKEYILSVISLVRERATFESDILLEGRCFFFDDVEFDTSSISKKWDPELTKNLTELLGQLFSIKNFSNTEIETSFKDYLSKSGLSFGKMMPMLRIAITGKLAGPSMFETLALIGKEKMKERITLAIKTLG